MPIPVRRDQGEAWRRRARLFPSSAGEQGTRPLPLLRYLMSKPAGDTQAASRLSRPGTSRRCQDRARHRVGCASGAARDHKADVLHRNARARRPAHRKTNRLPKRCDGLAVAIRHPFRARLIAGADLIICGTRGSSRCRWPTATGRRPPRTVDADCPVARLPRGHAHKPWPPRPK